LSLPAVGSVAVSDGAGGALDVGADGVGSLVVGSSVGSLLLLTDGVDDGV
jgi:hypothetical protein